MHCVCGDLWAPGRVGCVSPLLLGSTVRGETPAGSLWASCRHLRGLGGWDRQDRYRGKLPTPTWVSGPGPWGDGMPLGGVAAVSPETQTWHLLVEHLSQGLEDGKELLAWRRRGRHPARRTACAAAAGCGVCREGPYGQSPCGVRATGERCCCICWARGQWSSSCVQTPGHLTPAPRPPALLYPLVL